MDESKILRKEGLLINEKHINFKIVIKRIIDIIGAISGLILFMPIGVIIFYLVKKEDSGPFLHYRKVIGLKGKEFFALKIRSMKVDADEFLKRNKKLMEEFKRNYKLKNDPRITNIGRFIRKYSIDEVPQLINVLKGDMSLVGPRIITREELEKFGHWREKRLSVKPGLTGLWQVNGRQNVDYNERIKMDIYYIDNWSLWLDTKILLKTIVKVLKKEGAL